MDVYQLTLNAWILVILPVQTGQDCSSAAWNGTTKILAENASTIVHSDGGQKVTSALIYAAVESLGDPLAARALFACSGQGEVSSARKTCLLGSLQP